MIVNAVICLNGFHGRCVYGSTLCEGKNKSEETDFKIIVYSEPVWITWSNMEHMESQNVGENRSLGFTRLD